MKLTFAVQAWEDYLYWEPTDAAIGVRLNALIKECRRHPFTGTGRPEPLKGDLKGCWSRRITLQDRLVYRIAGAGPDQTLEIARFGSILERLLTKLPPSPHGARDLRRQRRRDHAGGIVARMPAIDSGGFERVESA